MLFSNLKENTKKGDLICFSYSLPLGNDYDIVMHLAENKQLTYRKEEHSNGKGVTIYKDHNIFQTYLSSSDFKSILNFYEFDNLQDQVAGTKINSLYQRK